MGGIGFDQLSVNVASELLVWGQFACPELVASKPTDKHEYCGCFHDWWCCLFLRIVITRAGWAKLQSLETHRGGDPHAGNDYTRFSPTFALPSVYPSQACVP